LVFTSGYNTASPDYLGYKKIMEASGDFGDIFNTDFSDIHGDPIFYLLSSIINSLNIDVQFTFLLISSLSIGILLFVVFKESTYPILSMLMYISHHYLNKDMIQIRAGIASSFLLLCIYFLVNRKYVKSSVASILSILSHSSSFISVIPFLFYKTIKVTHVRKVAVVLLFMSAIMYKIDAFGFFVSNFGDLLPLSVQGYIKWESYNYNLGLLSISTIRALLISTLLIVFYDRIVELNDYTKTSFWFYIIGTCFILLFNDVAILSGRLSSMLFSIDIILLVNFAASFKSKITLIILIFYSSANLYYNLYVNSFSLGSVLFDFY